MLASRWAFAWLLALPAIGVAQEGNAYPDPARTVTAFLNEETAPLVRSVVADLSASDASNRERAAKWLVDFLRESLRVEHSSEKPDRHPRFWKSDTRYLRSQIASALHEAQSLDAAALPVVRWYLDSEVVPWTQYSGAGAVNLIRGPEAAKLRREIVSGPHDNLMLVADVLRRMTTNKETMPRAELLALCRHHRPSVRDAAGKLFKQQEGAEPPAFDPVQAMRSPAVRKLLEKIAALELIMPPADAPWIEATTRTYRDGKESFFAFTESGWLVKKLGDSAIIATP
jgi:hypothetical protein